MYADDVVLMAETETDLQKMLDTVYSWMTKWRITLNLKKSKCVDSRPKILDKTNYKFHINNVPLEFAKSYKYLGVYFNQFLDFEGFRRNNK